MTATTPTATDAGPEADAAVPPRGDEPSAPPHRLRDLDRRGRIVAAVVALLLVTPVAASIVHALDVGWRPSNDDALIVLRAFDVLSTDPPLVGQPSTTHMQGDGLPSRHPGPIEFYLLALPVELLGPIVGTLLTIAAISVAALLLTVWVAYRRAGPAVALGAATLVSLSTWTQATAVLTDPVSSNLGGFALMAGAALAWALWCDDRRLWPLAVAVWSFTIQQHLAIFGIAGLVAVWGLAGAVVTTVRARADEGRLRSSARWAGASAVVGLTLWAPPLVDQLFGTGNLGRILGFAGEDRLTLGPEQGLRTVGRAVGGPPILLQRRFSDGQLGGWLLVDPYIGQDLLWVAVGLAAFAVAAAAAVVAWRRHPARPDARARAALVGTVVVLAVGGAITVDNVPDSFESARINFYRWAWVLAIAAWGTVLWSAGVALGPRLARLPDRVRSAAPVAVVLVLAVVTASTATADGVGDRRRDEQMFGFEAEAVAGVLDALPDDGRPVRLDMAGAAALFSVGPALAVALEHAGHPVRVDPGHSEGYDERRVVPPEVGEARVLVRTSAEPLPGDDDLGTRVATFETDLLRPVWFDHHMEVWVDVPDGP